MDIHKVQITAADVQKAVAQLPGNMAQFVGRQGYPTAPAQAAAHAAALHAFFTALPLSAPASGAAAGGALLLTQWLAELVL